MKIFLSESVVNYKTYTFNYALYCMMEKREELPEIYHKGFLPYSNDITLQTPTFYMARSLRVDLDRFAETSENRRVVKKISGLNPGMEKIPVKQFDLTNAQFREFCLQFAKERFSEPLSGNRLEYILNSTLISDIFVFKLNGKEVGWVLTVIEGNTLHYWFAFFSFDYFEYSLGKFMMFSVIKWAFENNLEYVYLGTVYGDKSLYKVRDFKGLAFFDGNHWNADMKLLKSKCKSDKAFTTDFFKQDTAFFLKNLEDYQTH